MPRGKFPRLEAYVRRWQELDSEWFEMEFNRETMMSYCRRGLVDTLKILTAKESDAVVERGMNARTELGWPELKNGGPSNPWEIEVFTFSELGDDNKPGGCPNCFQVLLQLRVKGIAYREIGIDMTKAKKWFVTQINPKGTCPAIRHQGRVVADTENIRVYIEKKFANRGPALMDEHPATANHPMPFDPWDHFTGDPKDGYNVIRMLTAKLSGDTEALNERKAYLVSSMQTVEAHLKTLGRTAEGEAPWLSGGDLHFVDIRLMAVL